MTSLPFHLLFSFLNSSLDSLYFFSFVKFLKAQLKRKVHNKSKWHVGNKIKRRKLSQAKDNGQTAVNNQVRSSDTEESQPTSTEHNELGNTGESSVEENEKQNVSENNLDLKNTSSTSNIENELEESNEITECTDLRKENIDCSGDASSSQVIDIPDENESKEMCILRMTRARRSQVEQQQLISVEKALAILSQPTPSLVVDHRRLKVRQTEITGFPWHVLFLTQARKDCRLIVH